MSSTFKTQTKYIRISPRKARLAADLIRGMQVKDAESQLRFSQLKAGRLLQKTLKTAVANTTSTLKVAGENLYIEEIRVDAGPIIKRSKSKSKGGRVPVMKRTSHFTIVLATSN